jgi:hypothetical protein
MPSLPLTGQALEALKATHPFLRGAIPGALRRDPTDAGIGTGNFTQGIPAFWFARSIEYGSSENLYAPYADSPWVRSAIQKIAQPISSCEILFSNPSSVKVRRKSPRLKQLSTSRGIVYRAEDELIDLPQISEWLKEPVTDLTYQDFVEASIGWLKMQECFWVLDQSRLVPFPEASLNPYAPIKIPNPSRMRPTIEDGEIVDWVLTLRGGKTVHLEPDQVVRLRGWNPYDDFRGLGDYRAVHIAAEADWLAEKFSRNLMANNGDTSRIIAVKGGQPSDAQRAQLIAEFKARRNASLRGESRDVVVGGDVELHNAELASVDAGFVSQRIENRHTIYNGLGVPMSMADIKASYSIGSASDMFQLLINTCIPTGGKFCGALEKLIFKMTGKRVEVGLNWDEHPCMQEVRKERLDSIAKLAEQGMPMEEINEYLALGLVQYPGWEVGYIPFNVQPVLNEQGEVNPAPMPGDFSEGEEPINDNPANEDDGDTPEVKSMLEALRERYPAPVFRGSAENKKLWESHMRLRSKSVKRYQGKVGKVLSEYRIKALKVLEAAGKKSVVTKSLVDIVFDPKSFVRDLISALDPAQREALNDAVRELHDEIGQPDDPWTMPPQRVLDFLNQREDKLSGTGDMVFSAIKSTLEEGIENGEGMDKLAGRIKAVFNELSNYEARRIAMTETAAAYGYARNAAMVAAGITHKSWLTNHGPNVRVAHRQAESDYGSADKAIPVSDPFVVGGEPLMYPGDESGSAKNVINCHCIQLARKAPKQ